ncbi:hypothetical protein HY025_04150 [Candidatus Daviesbacteria bacterium]|nr:hypothetical protein [Candidatus Daviesbacteria bacterium]
MPEIILGALILIIAILFFREYYLRQKLLKHFDQEEAARQKSFELIHQAIERSQAILADAELDSIKIAAQNSLQTKKYEQDLEQKLASSIQETSGVLSKEESGFRDKLQGSLQEFAKYLTDLKSKADLAQQSNQDLIKSQINQIFEKFEQNLADFLAQTEQHSVSTIDTEIRATRQLINTYKEEQLRLIDENIIAILERTLSLVLAKKLTLKDQVDLVYEALEKAKIEKFIS